MKKVSYSFLIFLFLFVFKLIHPNNIVAALPEACPLKINGVSSSETIFANKIPIGTPMAIEFDISSVKDNFSAQSYSFYFPDSQVLCTLIPFAPNRCGASKTTNSSVTYTTDYTSATQSLLLANGVHKVELVNDQSGVTACTGDFEVENIEPDQRIGNQCNLKINSSNGVCNIDSDITIHVENADLVMKLVLDGPVKNEMTRSSCNKNYETCKPIDWNVGKLVAGDYNISAYYRVDIPTLLCQGSFNIGKRTDSFACNVIPTPTPIPPTPTLTPIPTPTITPTPPSLCFENTGAARVARENNICSGDFAKCPWCIPTIAPTRRPIRNLPIPDLKPLCDQLPAEKNFRENCWACQKTGGIWSALGCLPTDFSALIKKTVFPVGLGIAGGVAFLYFLYGAFLILTSTGNAEKIEEAKQIIMSSLAGLLLIIFSIFLLQVIGVQILQLPGFG